MPETIAKTILNNQQFTLSVTPKNGASVIITPPPAIDYAVVTGAGKIALEPAADTQSVLVKSVPGQIGTASFSYSAADGGGATGTCTVTLQSSLAVTLNAAVSAAVPLT
jgi:hypothetical protein